MEAIILFLAVMSAGHVVPMKKQKKRPSKHGTPAKTPGRPKTMTDNIVVKAWNSLQSEELITQRIDNLKTEANKIHEAIVATKGNVNIQELFRMSDQEVDLRSEAAAWEWVSKAEKVVGLADSEKVTVPVDMINALLYIILLNENRA